MRRLSVLVLAAGCLAMAAPAVADDVLPPPWCGMPDTTWQMTDFADPWMVQWDAVHNSQGDPDIWMYADGWQWDETLSGRDGVISWGNFTNGFSMEIPNFPDPNEEKRVWIQVTYCGCPPALYEVAGMDPGGGVWGPGLPSLVDRVTHPDGWITDVCEIIIQPNPTSEFVGIRWDGPGFVDQIVVDTWCTPEPATLALVALGGLALLRRKR